MFNPASIESLLEKTKVSEVKPKQTKTRLPDKEVVGQTPGQHYHGCHSLVKEKYRHYSAL